MVGLGNIKFLMLFWKTQCGFYADSVGEYVPELKRYHWKK